MISKPTHVIRFAPLPIIILLAIIGCVPPTVISATAPFAQATPTPTPVPVTPAKLTVEDLKKLRWIEGTWRGTGANQPAFFERYRWENDSTLAVDGFENEKLEKVTDTTRFELKDGEFGGGSDGARYVATALDDNSIRFGPVLKVRNFFVWKRESKDVWTAIIQPLPRPDRPTKETSYRMERLPDARV